jgi:hypothetical protein
MGKLRVKPQRRSSAPTGIAERGNPLPRCLFRPRPGTSPARRYLFRMDRRACPRAAPSYVEAAMAIPSEHHRARPGSSSGRLGASTADRTRFLPMGEAPTESGLARWRVRSPDGEGDPGSSGKRLVRNGKPLREKCRASAAGEPAHRWMRWLAIGGADSPSEERARRWWSGLAVECACPRRRMGELAVGGTSSPLEERAHRRCWARTPLGGVNSLSGELARRRMNSLTLAGACLSYDQFDTKNRRSELPRGRAGSPLEVQAHHRTSEIAILRTRSASGVAARRRDSAARIRANDLAFRRTSLACGANDLAFRRTSSPKIERAHPYLQWQRNQTA